MKNYKNIPEKTSSNSKATSSINTKITEKDVQKSILEYLGYKKIWAWRNNVGSGFNQNPNGKIYFTRFGVKGMSDIIGILPSGTFLAIEVKKPGGILTEIQTDFLARVNATGGCAFMATCIEDVEAVLGDIHLADKIHG